MIERPNLDPLLILAAGESTRMGFPKGLAKSPAGSSLLEWQCRRFWKSGGSQVFLVLGRHAPEYLASLPWIEAGRLSCDGNSLAIDYVVNDRPERGSFSSLQVGLEGITNKPRGVWVTPVDVPLVDLSRLEIHEQSQVVIPTFQGRGGHPVWLGSRFCDHLRALSPESIEARLDRQIRAWDPSKVRRLPQADPCIRWNLNNPDEVQKWSEACAGIAAN